MTQEDLAAKTGLVVGTISAAERDKRKMRTEGLELVAAALEIPLSALFDVGAPHGRTQSPPPLKFPTFDAYLRETDGLADEDIAVLSHVRAGLLARVELQRLQGTISGQGSLSGSLSVVHGPDPSTEEEEERPEEGAASEPAIDPRLKHRRAAMPESDPQNLQQFDQVAHEDDAEPVSDDMEPA